MDQAVQDHPELVKEYFMTDCVPPEDNKYTALHGAVWSGGSFLYVPEGVQVDLPVQAYFRMNASSQGQFEHTLLIARPDSKIHYIEGCSAPMLTDFTLHSGCVEVFAEPRSSVQYSTVQNWSTNTYNLNSKRAIVEEEANMRWLSGSLGSRITMLYPASLLVGRGATSTNTSLSFAGNGQILDTGAKMIHLAPETSSTVNMKSISSGDGRTIYRGLVKVAEPAPGSIASVSCDSLLIGEDATTETLPLAKNHTDSSQVTHEATAGKINEDDLFYLTSRGIDREEALALIVKGFADPVISELPMEYAVELNRLIQSELSESGETVDREGYFDDWD
jgi:Fe-S cluster assembly protein SufB